MKEIKKIAKDFGGPCFITKDGQVFPYTKEGSTRARSHAGRSADVFEFGENLELIEAVDLEELRQTYISKIAEGSNRYQEEQLQGLHLNNVKEIYFAFFNEKGAPKVEKASGDLQLLEGMSQKELVDTLADLDPTIKSSKMNKDTLKSEIEKATALDPSVYDAEKLSEVCIALNEDAGTFGSDVTAENLSKGLNLGELKGLLLNLRDGVELANEISEKLTTL